MTRPIAVATLLLFALGSTSAQWMSHQSLTAIVEGTFERSDTHAIEGKTFDLLNLPREQVWQLIPGSTYVLTATFTDTLRPSISRVSITAPDGGLVADETAVPLVASLTARGVWRAPQQPTGLVVARDTFQPRIVGTVELGPGTPESSSVAVGVESTQMPAPQPATILVLARDAEGPLALRDQVTLWRRNGGLKVRVLTVATDDSGQATFTQLSPGEYLVEVHVAGYCHLQSTVPLSVPAGGFVVYPVVVHPHHGITGYVCFQDDDGKYVAQGPSRLAVELRQGDRVIAGTFPENGASGYPQYTWDLCLPAGQYTVRGIYGEQEATVELTVGDDCSAEHRTNPTIGPVPGSEGAHKLVRAPLLRFREQASQQGQ